MSFSGCNYGYFLSFVIISLLISCQCPFSSILLPSSRCLELLFCKKYPALSQSWWWRHSSIASFALSLLILLSMLLVCTILLLLLLLRRLLLAAISPLRWWCSISLGCVGRRRTVSIHRLYLSVRISGRTSWPRLTACTTRIALLLVIQSHLCVVDY